MAVHSSSSSQQASISNQSAGYNITNQFNHPKQYLALLMLVLWFHTHTQPQLSWSRTLIGIGVFLGLGASAAVVLKKLFVPRVKSWTQRSHAKGDENGGNELKSKLYEDIKEAIQASESAFSDIAKTNQGLLASKDEVRKILTKLAEAFDSQADAFKSLSKSLNHMSKNRFLHYNLLDHVQSPPWNGPTNNSWRDFQCFCSQQTHGNKNNTPPHSDFDPGKELHQTRKTPLPQRTYIWSISEIMAP